MNTIHLGMRQLVVATTGLLLTGIVPAVAATPPGPMAAGGPPPPGASAPAPARPSFDGIWQVDFSTSLAGRGESMQPTDGSPIPFQPWSAALHKGYQNDQRRNIIWGENNMRCLVAGPIRAMKGNFPFRLIETDGQFTLLFEEDNRVNIWYKATDHRKNTVPTWNGEHIAWWEGDTLVVDSIGFNGKTPFSHAVYVTTNLHTIHRFKLLPGGKQMEARIWVEDVGAFTKPFEARTLFNRLPDNYKLQDYRCAENNKLFPDEQPWWDALWGPE